MHINWDGLSGANYYQKLNWAIFREQKKHIKYIINQ